MWLMISGSSANAEKYVFSAWKDFLLTNQLVSDEINDIKIVLKIHYLFSPVNTFLKVLSLKPIVMVSALGEEICVVD